MGWVKNIISPPTPRDAVRNAITGLGAAIAVAWITALLTQLGAFQNPRGQLTAVGQFLTWLVAERWFIALSFLVFGAGAMMWIDAAAFRPKWWKGIGAFSIRDAACLLAGVSPGKFDTSQRAKGIANEIKGLVDSGHMPTHLETEQPTPGISAFGPYPKGEQPPYAPKQVDYSIIVSRKTIESFAHGRGYSLPWPRKARPGGPIYPETALSLGEFMKLYRENEEAKRLVEAYERDRVSDDERD